MDKIDGVEKREERHAINLPAPEQVEDTTGYPSGNRRYAIGFILGFSVVLPMLDISILSTALPSITNQFDSLTDVGWYGSAYLMACAITQLSWGKAYTVFSPLACFLWAIVVFEIGSIVSATAQNSIALIIGRATAGSGDGGIWTGSLCMIAYAFHLQQRPIVNAAVSVLTVGSTVLGPLVGGALVTRASWRWCFAINPIIGVPTFIASAVILRAIKLPERRPETFWKKVERLDWPGLVVLFPSIICLLLAMQWGGTQFSWSSVRIIILLILSALLLGVFALIQSKKKDEAMLPLRVLRLRTVAASIAYGFTIVAGSETISYYAPTWFQAIKGVNALQSGVMSLPLAVATCFCTVTGGILVSKMGHYVPFMILGSISVLAGTTLFTQFHADTHARLWAPTLVLVGAGIGLGTDLPQVAVQTVLSDADIPIGIGAAIFAQTIGQAIFVSVVGNVLNNELRAGFLTKLPSINSLDVLQAGATELQRTVNVSDLVIVRQIYNQAITRAFYACVAVAGLSLLAACAMEWNSVKDDVVDGGDGGTGASVPAVVTKETPAS